MIFFRQRKQLMDGISIGATEAMHQKSWGLFSITFALVSFAAFIGIAAAILGIKL